MSDLYSGSTAEWYLKQPFFNLYLVKYGWTSSSRWCDYGGTSSGQRKIYRSTHQLDLQKKRKIVSNHFPAVFNLILYEDIDIISRNQTH